LHVNSGILIFTTFDSNHQLNRPPPTRVFIKNISYIYFNLQPILSNVKQDCYTLLTTSLKQIY